MLSTTEGGRNCWNESRVDDSWELNELQPYDESSTEKLSYQCMMFFKKMRWKRNWQTTYLYLSWPHYHHEKKTKDVTLFSHVGRFYDPGICLLYFVGSLNKVGIFVYCSYIQAELGNSGGIIILALCVRMIVHPKNIPWNYFLSLLFIATFSLKIPTLFTIFVLFIRHYSFICTNVSFFSYFVSFFPWR